MIDNAEEKLRALLEGLECNNIDLLLPVASVQDFRRLGETMAERIKETKRCSIQQREGER